MNAAKVRDLISKLNQFAIPPSPPRNFNAQQNIDTHTHTHTRKQAVGGGDVRGPRVPLLGEGKNNKKYKYTSFNNIKSSLDFLNGTKKFLLKKHSLIY